MNPRSFIDQLCVRQVVSDVRQPARVHGDVNSSTLGVVTVLGAAYGLIEGLATETAVDAYRLLEVLPERLQDLLAEPD